MITIGAFEAKTHLSRLLEQVMNGEQVTITRHGVPVAKLVSIREGETNDPSAAIQKLRDLSQKVTLGGISVKQLIIEGRNH